jgi:hypothetical protein
MSAGISILIPIATHHIRPCRQTFYNGKRVSRTASESFRAVFYVGIWAVLQNIALIVYISSKFNHVDIVALTMDLISECLVLNKETRQYAPFVELSN